MTSHFPEGKEGEATQISSLRSNAVLFITLCINVMAAIKATKTLLPVLIDAN